MKISITTTNTSMKIGGAVSSASASLMIRDRLTGKVTLYALTKIDDAVSHASLVINDRLTEKVTLHASIQIGGAMSRASLRINDRLTEMKNSPRKAGTMTK